MKKYLIIPIAVLLAYCMASCSSSDNDDPENEKETIASVVGKSYVFRNDTLIVCLTFESQEKASLQTYIRGYVSIGADWNGTLSGDFPTILFDSQPEFAMTCQFNNQSSFNATVATNNLVDHFENHPVKLPSQMRFTESYRIRDLNGDMIINEMDIPWPP